MDNECAIATVFLGGTSRTAAVSVNDDEFEDAIDGLQLLLIDCAERFLGDSFLYNSVKHGLTAIDVDDDEARIEWKQGEKSVLLHKGPMHVYIHAPMYPGAPRELSNGLLPWRIPTRNVISPYRS